MTNRSIHSLLVLGCVKAVTQNVLGLRAAVWYRAGVLRYRPNRHQFMRPWPGIAQLLLLEGTIKRPGKSAGLGVVERPHVIEHACFAGSCWDHALSGRWLVVGFHEYALNADSHGSAH